MKYNTIIFDLDGTLLNTLDDLWASVNHAMRENGFPERTRDEVRRFVGNGVKMLIKRSVPEGITEEQYWSAYNSFEKYYAIHSRDNTAPYDGILELVSTLKKNGCSVAIVSNKIDFAVKDLRDKFFKEIDVAIGDRDDTKNKPEPDMVFKAVKELGVDIKDCVYVGDTDVDLETAHNSGMDCISVSWGFRSREELEGYKAKMIADKACDILKFLGL